MPLYKEHSSLQNNRQNEAKQKYKQTANCKNSKLYFLMSQTDQRSFTHQEILVPSYSSKSQKKLLSQHNNDNNK